MPRARVATPRKVHVMPKARRSRNGNGALAPNTPRGTPIPIASGTVELIDEADGSVTVYVNGVPSSSLNTDPDVLDFEYMRHEAAAIKAWDAGRDDHAWLALHVGAAACTLPRHLAHAHPLSRHIAVDVDVALAEYARRWWDLPRAPRLRIREEDGLVALSRREAGTLDLVVRDAFAGDTTPPHLAGAPWWGHAKRVLRSGGLVVANTAVRPADRASGDDAKAAAGAFGAVLVVGEHAVLKRKRRGNVILVTGADDEVTAALKRYAASAPLPTGVVAGWS